MILKAMRRKDAGLTKKKTLYHLTKGLRDNLDRFVMHYALLPDRTIFSERDLPWIEMIRANWQSIRAEAIAIRAADIPSLGDISPDHGRIAADRRWRSYFLEGYGYRRRENRARVPMTASLIDSIPDLVTASFSVLEPGCHIPRHRGMTKGLLTFHLALKVPQDREHCWIQFETPEGLRVIPWEDGRTILFDDTYNHEVWNNTSDPRYILLLQVRRPCRWPARAVLRVFMWGVRYSRFVQDIRKRLDARQA